MNFEKIFKKSFNIKKQDKVLIITDKNKLYIAKKFLRSLRKISKNISLIVKNTGKYHGEEPSEKIAKKMQKNDIVIAITTYSLTHTNARRKATKTGVKFVSMPGFTGKMFRSLTAEPIRILQKAKKIEKLLKETTKIRISTVHGTDLSFSVKGRMTEIDSGDFTKLGSFGNMPAGEISTSPVEGTAEGVLVINSMENYARNRTFVYIEKGRAVDINDKKCRLAEIFRKVKNSTNIAEFGIGVNYKAKIMGNILQDEKVLGTCHIAFGNNKSYSGKVYSKVHLDAILFKPTIWFDKKRIINKGNLRI